MVYLYALSLSRSETQAEEITQETFFQALDHLDSFRGDCKISTWLCQIAKNIWLSLCKKEKRIRRDVTADLLPESPSLTLEESLMDKDEALRIHQIVHHLKEPYKEVFQLRIFAELSFRQIGQLFGKTEGWARVTYYRAKIMIKEELQ